MSIISSLAPKHGREFKDVPSTVLGFARIPGSPILAHHMTFTLIIGFYVGYDRAASAIPRYVYVEPTELENTGSAHYGTGTDERWTD